MPNFLFKSVRELGQLASLPELAALSKPLAMSTPPNDERSPKKWLKQKFRSVFPSKSTSRRNLDVPDALSTSTNVPINTSFLAVQATENSQSDVPHVKADRTGSGE